MTIELDLTKILTWESIIGAVLLSCSAAVARDIFHLFSMMRQLNKSKQHWRLENEFYEMALRFVRQPTSRIGRLWVATLISHKTDRSMLLVEHIQKYEQSRDKRRKELRDFLPPHDYRDSPAGSVDLADFILFKVDDIFSLGDDCEVNSYVNQAKKCKWSLGKIEADDRKNISDYVESKSFLRFLPSSVHWTIRKRMKK